MYGTPRRYGFPSRRPSNSRKMEYTVTKVRLGIDQITPGMKLAEPITNASGVTLMPDGIRLTPMFINRLKKWNIESLEVVVERRTGESSTTATVVRPQSTSTKVLGMTAEQEEFARSIAADVSRRFVNVRDNPLMMQLRSVAIRRLVAHGPGGMLNVMRRAAESEEKG